MKRILKWSAALLALVIGAAVVLFIATSGDYSVPATVADDAALPALEADAIRLHGEVHGPDGAPVIIVLHGGPGGDYRSLLPLAALAESHRVVFYDQRGAGLSQRVDAQALTLDGYLAELTDIARQFSPDAPLTLIGHSWGAMLASAWLGEHPERVARAVLIEPGMLTASDATAWQAQARAFMGGPGAGLIEGFRAQHVRGPDAAAADDFLWGNMAHRFAAHPDNPYHCPDVAWDSPTWRFGADASRQAAATPGAVFDRLSAGAHAFGGPVLFLTGACDSWIGAPLQQTHAALFSDARLIDIPGAGHDVIDDQPDLALAQIRAFLDG